jgi:hypothetical protein
MNKLSYEEMIEIKIAISSYLKIVKDNIKYYEKELCEAIETNNESLSTDSETRLKQWFVTKNTLENAQEKIHSIKGFYFNTYENKEETQ